MTSFELSEYPILDEIRPLLAPDAAAVLAHPYKLNVYAKGGFFKSHMDTPRTGSVFGTLVVCLPSPFDGGAFEVEHNGQTHAFEWEGEFQVDGEYGDSSNEDTNAGKGDSDANRGGDEDGEQEDSPRPTKRTKQALAARLPRAAARWCAYYADCSHQVLEVTRGYRVTLTYLLENVDNMPVGDIRSMESNPFFNKLYELVKGSEVAKGDRIGFALEHEYVVDADGTMPLLKGFDRFLKYTLEALQLTFSIEMVFLAEGLADSDEEEDEEDWDSEGDNNDAAKEKLDGEAAFIGNWKTAGGAVKTGYGGDSVEDVAHDMIGATGPERVIWIAPPYFTTQYYKVYSAVGYRDGETSPRKYHACAAFLVTI
jgi:hypothetical protein